MANSFLTRLQSLRGALGSKISWRPLVLILTPLFASLIPIFWTSVKASVSRCVFILVVMGVYWTTEVVPIPVTALVPLFAFPVLGVLGAKQVAPAYFPDIIILFFGGLMIAIAVEEVNLHRRISLMILSRMGAQPRWIMLGIMTATALLSAFISNTATTAMMTPIVISLSTELIAHGRTSGADGSSSLLAGQPVRMDGSLSPAEAGLAKSLLLATCYSASIGGTLTLIGTGPNLVLAGLLGDAYPKNPISFASWMGFWAPGFLICLILAWLVLQALVLHRHKLGNLCKKRKKLPETLIETKLMGPENSYDKGAGKSAPQGGLSFVNTQLRELGPPTWAEKSVIGWFFVLLIVWITRKPLWNPWLPGCSDSTAAIMVALALLVWPFEAPAWMCKRRRHRGYAAQRDRSNIDLEMVQIEEKGEKRPNRDGNNNKHNLATSKNNNDNKNSSDNSKNSENEANRTILSWPIVVKRMPWGVLFLLGGGFAVGKAVIASGLSDLVGGAIESLSVSPLGLSIATVILMTYMTEFTSNTATSNVLLPIILGVARAKCINPLYLGLPVTLAGSFAFMLPVATPPNAIVFQAGGILRVADMLFVGSFMNIICMFAVIGGVNTWGSAMWNLSEWPEWANVTCGVAAFNLTGDGHIFNDTQLINLT